MAINGKPGTIEKVDATTVRFNFPEPYSLLPGHAGRLPPIVGGQASATAASAWAASRRPTT